MIRGFAVLVVAAFTMLPLTALGAAADGMSQVYVPAYDSWELAIEDSQFAMISLVDGKENLVIQASIDAYSLNAGAKAVWFFPIPSSTEDANISIVQTMTSLDGYFLKSLAKRELDRSLTYVYMSQLYPIIPLGLTTQTFGGTYGGKDMLSGGSEDGMNDTSGLVISEHVEAFGLASELISAQDSAAIDSYLSDKGLDLASAADEQLDAYVGQEYSFVVSWITNMSEFQSMSHQQYGYTGTVYMLGVSVTFPAERMYYPLKLTSIYGNREIPMVIQVLGRASSLSFQDEREQAMVDEYQCVDPSYYVTDQNAWFFRNELRARSQATGTIDNVEFTIITMAGASQYLTEDLWIDPHWETGSSTLSFVYNNSWVVALAVMVSASVLASVAAGWIAYRAHRPDFKMFAALGLMNLLTLGGLIAATFIFDIERDFLNPRTERIAGHRKADFILSFTVLFIGVTLLLHGVALYVLT